jgi:Down syndrome cell adhesion protein
MAVVKTCSRIVLHWCMYTRYPTSYFMPVEPTGPPLGVQGRALDSRTIELSWQQPDPAYRNGPLGGYHVLYEEAGLEQATPPMPVTLDASRTTLTLRDLKKYTQYSVRVRAFNMLGDGPWSPTVLVMTAEDGM